MKSVSKTVDASTAGTYYFGFTEAQRAGAYSAKITITGNNSNISTETIADTIILAEDTVTSSIGVGPYNVAYGCKAIFNGRTGNIATSNPYSSGGYYFPCNITVVLYYLE